MTSTVPAMRFVTRIMTMALLAAPARATVEATFIESAPKDRFIIENTGPCPLERSQMVIDLATSAGRLIFDTRAAGPGVDVFQPFEVAEGELELDAAAVEDGGSRLTLRMGALPAGAQAAFTIDVDVTAPASVLGSGRVAGSEIAGASVRIETPGRAPATGVFGADGRAAITAPACP